jgi:redox-sensing transcriptional repressor
MISSRQTILRLFQYRKFLARVKASGLVSVYSATLAEASGATAEQVRKDFSRFGLSGNKKAGYKVDDLLGQLDELLGKGKPQKVIIVGAGNLGRALMRYEGFPKEGIEIAALFDNDPLKYNSELQPQIFPVERIYEFAVANKIELGVVAVPYHSAQQVLDLMVLSGIKGVLNFAPIYLKAPKDIYVHNMNVNLELETVAYFVKNRES